MQEPKAQGSEGGLKPEGSPKGARCLREGVPYPRSARGCPAEPVFSAEALPLGLQKHGGADVRGLPGTGRRDIQWAQGTTLPDH